MLVSIVIILERLRENDPERFRLAQDFAASLSPEYEVILVDNTGDRLQRKRLQEWLGDPALNNFHVFSLLRRIGYDGAVWVGMENAIGDLVLLVEPEQALFDWLSARRDWLNPDTEIVLIRNAGEPGYPFPVVFLRNLFVRFYGHITGNRIDLATTKLRVVSRKVIHYILQTQDHPLVFRYLINSVNLFHIRQLTTDRHIPGVSYPRRTLWANVLDAYKLMVGSSIFPLRLVNILSMLGAVVSVLYSLHIVVIYLTQPDVQPGWASLSMQFAFFFLLISVVLATISEYLILIITQMFKNPRYYVDSRYLSGRSELYEKLNVKE
jgi:polyisoprenyl-phosphate glycosyltransferase